MDDGSWFAIRPSGTEPKIKLYIYSKDKEDEESQEQDRRNWKKIVTEKMYSVE